MVKHIIYDSVEGQLSEYKYFSDVKDYAKNWCQRLNEENKNNGEPHRYKVDDNEDIYAIFEMCNITWHITD